MLNCFNLIIIIIIFDECVDKSQIVFIFRWTEPFICSQFDLEIKWMINIRIFYCIWGIWNQHGKLSVGHLILSKYFPNEFEEHLNSDENDTVDNKKNTFLNTLYISTTA